MPFSYDGVTTPHWQVESLFTEIFCKYIRYLLLYKGSVKNEDAMKNLPDTFFRNHHEAYTNDVQIVTSLVDEEYYCIECSKNHVFGVSPGFESVTPISYDFGRHKDYKWSPHTVGYLPPGMAQSGALLHPTKATNVVVSHKFFLSSAPEGIDNSSFDLREFAAETDEISSKLMLTLAAISESGNKREWSILVDSVATALCARTMQKFGAKTKPPERLQSNLSKSIQYINDNIQNSITLDDIALASGFSRFHFARQFKAQYGVAPHEYVTARRVEKSLMLIGLGQASLGQIAFMCGFCSQSHMTKVIKSHTGSTPGQHLKMHWGKSPVRTDLL